MINLKRMLFVVTTFFVATTFLKGEEDTKLMVCATVPELGSLVNEMGGEHVSVTVFTKGSEDPHFLTAKPSFVKKLSQADLLVFVGVDLEKGWLPVLVKGAKNNAVKKNSAGYLDCSTFVKITGLPTRKIDRSHGHVHTSGDPHFLLDPINGLKVAGAIRDRLIQLKPKYKETFEKNFSNFHQKLSQKMIGEKLTKKYKKTDELEKLALLFEHGKLSDYLKEQKENDLLKGWFLDMLPLRGKKMVADHNMWGYFSKRFNFKISLFLEEKPGITPSTKHLQTVVKKMKEEQIDIIIQSAYFNSRYGKFVSQHTQSKVFKMANQVGAVENTDDYISMIDHNVLVLANGFKSK